MNAQETPNVTESEARCFMADANNDILRIVFGNIKGNMFDPFLPLEFMNEDAITNFELSMTGFLSVQNFENLAEELKDKEIDDIVAGTITIKQLSPKEAQELIAESGSVPKKGKNGATKTVISKIKDATYSVVSRNGRHSLVLKTSPVKYYTKHADKKITSKDIFYWIRNNSAHNIAYKSDGSILFFVEDGYIEVSKMWFRGYSELFAKEKPAFDIEKARTILERELKKSGNELQNFDDIKKALSLIKDCFDKDISSNYFRVHNFVKLRLDYHENFYSHPFEDKFDTLLQILEKNPNYLRNPQETISPQIIYNIQQVVALELMARDTKAKGNGSPRLAEMKQEIDERKARIQKRKDYLRTLSKRNPTLDKILQRDIDELNALITSYNQMVITNSKHETTDMNLFDASETVYFPIEMAVNTIALMAYNSLVTSGYYEDTISKTNYTDLSPAQRGFFDRLNLDSLDYIYRGRALPKPYSAESKIFILSAIRNSICHSLISYKLPSLRQGQKANFNDAEITFFLDRNDIQVVGTVADMYEIFTSEEFFKKRPEGVMTKPSSNMKFEVPEDLVEISKFEKASSAKTNGDGSEE